MALALLHTEREAWSSCAASFGEDIAAVQTICASVQAQVDSHFGLQQDVREEEPLSLSVDPDNVIDLSAEDVLALTYQNLVDIWRVSPVPFPMDHVASSEGPCFVPCHSCG